MKNMIKDILLAGVVIVNALSVSTTSFAGETEVVQMNQLIIRQRIQSMHLYCMNIIRLG